MSEQLPPLPEAQFSAWFGEQWKTLVNPTGVCNAFARPPRIPEDPSWLEKGYHSEPLYTADQMHAFRADGIAAATAALRAEIDALRRDAEAMAQALEHFEAQGSDKTEALRKYRAAIDAAMKETP